MIRRFRLRRAYRAVASAEAAHSAACARGDTRAIHTTRKALQAARHAALGLELRGRVFRMGRPE